MLCVFGSRCNVRAFLFLLFLFVLSCSGRFSFRVENLPRGGLCCAVLFRLLLVSVSIMSPAALCAAAVCVSPRRRRPGQPLRRLPAAALVPGHCACAVTWPVYKRPVARGRGSPGITTLAATTPPLTQGSRHSLETGVLPPYSGTY